MTDRVRLDGYLPVLLGGERGYCCEFALDSLVIDLPSPGTALPHGPLPLTVMASPRVRVRGTGRIAEEVVKGAPAGMRRLLVLPDPWPEDALLALQGHLSSLRKSAHLGIVAGEDVETKDQRAGFHRWRLPHRALPELDAADIDLSTELFGRTLDAPLLMAGMTGGSERAGAINERLAVAAAELGLGMGLGSQRAMLELPELARTFQVRRWAPEILLLANIGAVQLNLGVTVDACRRLVHEVEADALAVHLNVLQEAVQPEGDRDWSGLLRRIEAVVRGVGVPVLVKETGAGLDAPTARRLVDVGVAAFDVGGSGGTSWGWIEGFRAADPHRKAIGATFRDWGTPTAEAIVRVRAAVGPDVPIQATGGLRTGLDVAVALALGADVGGMALPFFRAADQGVDETVAVGRRVLEELRIAALCTGSRDVRALKALRPERAG